MAADANGDFAIKEAGSQTCENFMTAWDQNSPDMAQYAGWIAGYLTGLNQHAENVYDVAPWQSTGTLLGLTRSVCAQLPGETSFINATVRLVRELWGTRLTGKSELQGVRRDGKAIVIYDAVLTQAIIRLNAIGYDAGPADMEFSDDASRALLKFQADRGLTSTGLPDQETLFELFVRTGN